MFLQLTMTLLIFRPKNMPLTSLNLTAHKKHLPFAISPLFVVKTLVLNMFNELKKSKIRHYLIYTS